MTTTEDDLLVKVPFMTTDVRDWTIFVTPSSHTYVTYSSNKQLVNGETKLSDIKNSLEPIDADGIWELTVTANNKNNAKIKKNYTLTIDLESPKDGKTLADLDFSATAQTTDKLIALRSEQNVNTFDAQIDTHTNGSTNVTNLNLEVPVSLTDKNDLGLDYSNVVTNFATNNGGVAYYVESSNGNGLTVKPLAAIDPSNASKVTGTKLADAATSDANNDNRVNDSNSGETDNGYWKILVLPEKTARALNNSDSNYITQADAATGTLYNVNIDVKSGDNKSRLLTFKVGNTTLTVDEANGVISGELPFSATVETAADVYTNATFVEFTTSPYAQLFDTFTSTNSPNGVKYFSNGDIEGDTLVDAIDDNDNARVYASKDNYAGLNNYKLAFVRNSDHTVTVYRVGDDDRRADGVITNQALVVRA